MTTTTSPTDFNPNARYVCKETHLEYADFADFICCQPKDSYRNSYIRRLTREGRHEDACQFTGIYEAAIAEGANESVAIGRAILCFRDDARKRAAQKFGDMFDAAMYAALAVTGKTVTIGPTRRPEPSKR